jgi:uncharacterized protein (DUF924 family)
VTNEPHWVRQVLDFWFSELQEADWWAKSEVTDAVIRERFLALHERLAADDGPGSGDCRTLLATVIVLDQFSRHLFRGSPRAYDADPIARRLARHAIARGCDSGMRDEERMFLYLPFEHSEHPADQSLAVELFAGIGHEEWTRDALAHKALIDRFGRFPHRNAVLGRESTPEEIAALREPKGSF